MSHPPGKVEIQLGGDHGLGDAIRLRDLFERMLAAKIHGASAVFCPDPFAAQCGLMNDDGTPGELFLPWRTTALEIGGKQFLGRLTLPGGSRNAVFASGDRSREPMQSG